MVDAGGEVLGCRATGVGTKFVWVLRHCDRVHVDDAVEGVEVVLHLGPVDQGAKVVAEVERASAWLHSAQEVWLGHLIILD